MDPQSGVWLVGGTPQNGWNNKTTITPVDWAMYKALYRKRTLQRMECLIALYKMQNHVYHTYILKMRWPTLSKKILASGSMKWPDQTLWCFQAGRCVFSVKWQSNWTASARRQRRQDYKITFQQMKTQSGMGLGFWWPWNAWGRRLDVWVGLGTVGVARHIKCIVCIFGALKGWAIQKGQMSIW